MTGVSHVAQVYAAITANLMQSKKLPKMEFSLFQQRWQLQRSCKAFWCDQLMGSRLFCEYSRAEFREVARKQGGTVSFGRKSVSIGGAADRQKSWVQVQRRPGLCTTGGECSVFRPVN